MVITSHNQRPSADQRTCLLTVPCRPSSSLQQGRQSPLPSPVRTSFHLPAHSESQTSFLAPAQSVVRPLDLGFHPSNSQTSLLEAVVGPAKTAQAPLGSASSAYPQPSRQTQPSSFNTSRKPAPSAEERRVPSDSSKSYGTSTEREWDVLSDASLKLNEGEGDEKAVEELQKKVNRR